MQHLSDIQSAKVICRFDRLKTTHRRQKAIDHTVTIGNLLAAKPFLLVMVLRVYTGLTSCKGLATAVNNSLDNRLDNNSPL